MVKVLFSGDVDSNFEILIGRINELQKSAHGPFDLVLCTGQFFKALEELQKFLANTEFRSPIPIYILDSDIFDSPEAISTFDLLTSKNILILKGSGIQNILNLSVAYLSHGACTSEAKLKEEFVTVKRLVDSRGYRWFDILLTPDWSR